MFPTNRMGKATGDKPKPMKGKFDTGKGVGVLPLTTYQLINPSEFDEEHKLID